MSKYNAVVVTRSLRGGHYRAGKYHGPEATRFEPKTFTEQQMEHLAADPDLVLVDLVPEEAGASDVPASAPPAGSEDAEDAPASEDQAPAKARKKG